MGELRSLSLSELSHGGNSLVGSPHGRTISGEKSPMREFTHEESLPMRNVPNILLMGELSHRENPLVRSLSFPRTLSLGELSHWENSLMGEVPWEKFSQGRSLE